MNKIIYEDEMILSQWVDESCKRIEVLRAGIKETANEIIRNALTNELKQERNAIQSVLKWVTIN